MTAFLLLSRLAHTRLFSGRGGTVASSGVVREMRNKLSTTCCGVRTQGVRQCCNFQAEVHEKHDGGVASDCYLEQPSDEMELADNLTDAHLACPFRIPCTAS